jgi:hypothetical protein
MCGIVGFVGKPKSNPVPSSRGDWFEEALVCDVLRGMDSTGVVSVSTEGVVTTGKKAIWSPDYIGTRSYERVRRTFSDAQFLIGHNRKATTGSLGNDGAHPFTHGHITLVHNGSLAQTWRSDLGVFNMGFDVDSEAIAYALSQAPAEEVIPKIRGAFALVWYDAELKALRFVRNDDRPLHLSYNEGKDYFMFASEGGMIDWLATRNGFDMSKAYNLKPANLCSVDLDTLALEQEEIKLAVPFSYTTSGGGRSRKTTTPSTTKSTGGLLAEMNLKIDDSVTFEVDCRTILGKQPMADITCSPCWLPDDVKIQARNVPLAVLDTPNAKRFTGRVQSAYYQKGEKIIQVTDVRKSWVTDQQYDEQKRRHDALLTAEDKERTVVTLPDLSRTFPGPGGKNIPITKMDALTKGGCGICSVPLDDLDYPDLAWISDSPICEHCQGTEFYEEYMKMGTGG